VEGGGRTYAELAAALRGDLPPTHATGGSTADPAPLPLVVAAAAGASAWTVRRPHRG